MKISTKTIAIGGIFTAIVTLATMVLRFPTPTGPIHIGDSVVYLSGILLGPLLGGVVSALGSGISDLFGYVQYAPATVLIKFLDAFVTATVFYAIKKRVKGMSGVILAYVIGVTFGGLIMVGGYFAYELMLNGLALAITSLNLNIAQAVGGGLIGFPILIALEKTNYFSRLNKMF